MTRRIPSLSALLLVALTLSPVPVLAQRLSSIKAEGPFAGPGFRGEFSLQAISGPPARGEFDFHLMQPDLGGAGTFRDVVLVEGKVERVEFVWARGTAVVSGNCNPIAMRLYARGVPIPPSLLLRLHRVLFRVIVTDGAVQVALLEPRLDGLPGDTILRDGRYDSPVLPARVEVR